MREMLIRLLKELNKAYPKSIPIRTLKENGHEIAVINDAINGELVESISIPSLVDDPKLNNKEMALKLSIKGNEFLEKFKGDSSTTHEGDTNIKFIGNDNIVGIGQSHSQVKIEQSKKTNPELVLPPDNPLETIFLKLGEKLLKIVSGSLENGINKVRYISWIIILFNIFVIIIDVIWTKLILSWLVPMFVVPIILIVIFGSVIGYSSEERRCKNCNKYFAYRTMKKTKLGEGEYKGRMIYNIKEIDQCRFCGKEEIFQVTETDARLV